MPGIFAKQHRSQCWPSEQVVVEVREVWRREVVAEILLGPAGHGKGLVFTQQKISTHDRA